MTFSEIVDGCTSDEREQLAWHLSMLRARKTFEGLRHGLESDRPVQITPERAFELGCIAMRQLAIAKCGNLTEGLQEGVMTDAGLTKRDMVVMGFQVDAIDEVEKDIKNSTVERAAYYGSYILSERECSEIKELFPNLKND